MRSKRSVTTLRVAYADTDQARVVHHASYFRYLEVARLEFWREHGFDYDRFEKESGLGLPVVEAKLRYRMPARFDDVLEIESWISEATRASVWVDAIIRKKSGDGPPAPGEVIHESRVRLACASFGDGTIRKIPDRLLDALLEPGHGV